jgi:hypothetical protein
MHISDDESSRLRKSRFLGRTDEENVMENEMKNTNGTEGAQRSCHLCFSIGGEKFC